MLDTFRDSATPWNEQPYWYYGRELQEADGIVLTPESRLATGATVIYGAGREQYGLNSEGQLQDYGNADALITTDAVGVFAFGKRLDGSVIFISHPTGWTTVEAGDFSPKMKLQLEPWATVTGILVNIKGAPVPGEIVSVEFDVDWGTVDRPHINFNANTTTGPNGEFVLTNAPPGELRLPRRIITSTFPNRGWQNAVQTRFYASPGETNDLGKVILDTPPPEPLLKRLKNKVGL